VFSHPEKRVNLRNNVFVILSTPKPTLDTSMYVKEMMIINKE
jgi:hypothetical protein